MRRAVMISTLALTSYALTAWAQAAPAAPAAPAPAAAPAAQGIKSSDIAGTWTVKTLVGPKDSVVLTSVFTITADGKATMQHPKGDVVPVRLVTIGGDSVVAEAGPFPSALRPGQTVTLLHTVTHYKGDASTGTIEAKYSSGDVFKAKTVGTRKK
jgi:hypothetical protein